MEFMRKLGEIILCIISNDVYTKIRLINFSEASVYHGMDALLKLLMNTCFHVQIKPTRLLVSKMYSGRNYYKNTDVFIHPKLVIRTQKGLKTDTSIKI